MDRMGLPSDRGLTARILMPMAQSTAPCTPRWAVAPLRRGAELNDGKAIASALDRGPTGA